MKKIISLLSLNITILLCIFTSSAYGQNVNDYLIVNDIEAYKASKKFSEGQGPGAVAGAYHFDADHQDITYRMSYFNLETRVGPEIQVTQHAGADSDQWLLHEIEDPYRDDDTLNASHIAPNPGREIDGNQIFYTWGHYHWLSNDVVVVVSFSDLTGTKPEPLEVVKAYLAKFPSTVTLTNAEIKGEAHNKKCIKDEMERRLWLCGKWYMQVQLEKATLDGIARDVHKHLEIFVNYREKYFSIDGKADREALASFKYTKNHTALKSKYEDLKQWWADNKDKDITLP